jgi:hypothetical protein
MNLPELSLKVGNTLFLLLGTPQLVGPALGPLFQRLLQNHKVNVSKKKQSSSDNTSQATHNGCVVDGDHAGLQGPHVLIVFEPILLLRGVIPIN